ncbi:helix-turn-helix domain-containing protein [Streptomyces sp. NPDC006134]|uniref:helix-turn-helix domain-containing protein n=1 Tax=Streptomyces sp. NPDC006134 TaxID=3154467 RepID=UPI0033C99D93
MAEQKPNAAARPDQGVRRTATHSGVTHVRAYQPDRYTIIGNHLAQHRELSLTAIGLATHILSLPDRAPVDIRSLAERFPEGRDRIAFALRELEAHGYLERVRERTEAGRLYTRTYAHHVPAAETAETAARTADGPVVGPVVGPQVRGTAREGVQDPVLPDTPATGGETEPPVPPTPPAPPVPPEVGDCERAPRDRHHDRAVALLAGLRRIDDRLTLSRRQVDRLAPAVAAWFAGGATTAVVHRVLTTGLPEDMRHPAGVLAHRLGELLPPPLPASPPAASADAGTTRHRPHPLQTCDGCERAFRAPEPGRCRDCRDQPPAADEPLRAA